MTRLWMQHDDRIQYLHRGVHPWCSSWTQLDSLAYSPQHDGSKCHGLPTLQTAEAKSSQRYIHRSARTIRRRVCLIPCTRATRRFDIRARPPRRSVHCEHSCQEQYRQSSGGMINSRPTISRWQTDYHDCTTNCTCWNCNRTYVYIQSVLYLAFELYGNDPHLVDG